MLICTTDTAGRRLNAYRRHVETYHDRGTRGAVLKRNRYLVDSDEVFCVIKRGEFLGSRRVVHVPGMPIGTTKLTAQDKTNVRTGIHLKVDVIMVAGAKDAEYFNSVKNFVRKCPAVSIRDT